MIFSKRKNVYSIVHLTDYGQWRSKGGGVGARALRRRLWGRTSTLFAVI